MKDPTSLSVGQYVRNTLPELERAGCGYLEFEPILRDLVAKCPAPFQWNLQELEQMHRKMVKVPKKHPMEPVEATRIYAHLRAISKEWDNAPLGGRR